MKIDLAYLKQKLPLSISFFEEIDSTSLYLKRCIKNGKVTCDLAIASYQSNGQGRTGKSFYSPKSSGLYLTFCFSEDFIRCADLTPRVALAAATAIDRCFPVSSGIKWVNDIYLDNRKIAGVLCQKIEGYFLIGIGINVEKPDRIPEELENRFGYICEECPNHLYSELIISLYEELLRWLGSEKNQALEGYRQRCVHRGREVEIEFNGNALSGTCVDIADDFSLLMEIDGELQSFSSGYMVLIKTTGSTGGLHTPRRG